ncbi:MAG: FISUMP domain-containing protein [Bacteroidales bacterium]
MKNRYQTRVNVTGAAIFLLLLATACREYEPPLVISTGVDEITRTTATAGGHIIDDGGREVSLRGLVWGVTADPDVEVHLGMTEEGGGTGIFSSRITGLSPNTTYYARAYATSSVGTAYGDSIIFTTAPSVPEVASRGVTDIGPNGAAAKGIITDDMGATVTARGFVWNREHDPSVESNEGITTDGAGMGVFEGEITGLQHSTVYYLKAYAANSVGTAYGEQLRFTTAAPVRPALNTAEISNLRPGSVVSGGNVISHGGAPVTARGIVVSTGEKPRVDDNQGIVSSGRGTGSFTSSIGGLEYGKLYYLRAWATNYAGTSYGEQISFTVPEPVPPAVSVTAVSDIGSFSATVAVDVEDDGGVDVSGRGLVWGRREDPGIENNDGIATADGGEGVFARELQGLVPGTTYYVRAWATNEAGTAYSQQQQFTTPVTLPAVTTTAVISFTGERAVFSSTLTDNGGDSETYRGMVIATVIDPDVNRNDHITYDGEGTGDFTSEFEHLEPGTTYYARAWAANTAGTVYGRQARFTTVERCGEDVTFTCGDEQVTYGTVSGKDGACWMDRNLGASRVASSRRDEEAFGNLYQWGRLADGHQYPHSDTTSVISISDRPGHGNFIISGSEPYDWRYPPNDELWQGDGGINDVCPAGWRLPSSAEWQKEKNSWRKKNRRSAYYSPLKLPSAGLRANDGRIHDAGRRGYYWSSDIDHIYSLLLNFNRWSAVVNSGSRAGALSVRCIREEVRTEVNWLP